MDKQANRIKVVTGYSGDCPYKDIVVNNLRQYCDLYGYQLATKFDGWGEFDRHPFWRKQQLIMREISDCDLLLWVDADCLVSNMTIKIEDCILSKSSVVMSHEEDGWQAGVMLFRNDASAFKFLHDWWDAGDAITGDNWILERMLGLINPSYYRIQKGYPNFVRKHVHFQFKQSFIVHCPGCLPEEKLSVMKELSESVFTPSDHELIKTLWCNDFNSAININHGSFNFILHVVDDIPLSANTLVLSYVSFLKLGGRMIYFGKKNKLSMRVMRGMPIEFVDDRSELDQYLFDLIVITGNANFHYFLTILKLGGKMLLNNYDKHIVLDPCKYKIEKFSNGAQLLHYYNNIDGKVIE